MFMMMVSILMFVIISFKWSWMVILLNMFFFFNGVVFVVMVFCCLLGFFGLVLIVVGMNVVF